MTVNNRIFYACQAVGIKPCFTSEAITVVHGAQSIGINTTFELEQAFELGMIQIYENIEGLPDVEVTLEKVLDGYPLMYHLTSPGATSTNITGRSKERCCVSLGIYGDDRDVVSGVAPVEVYASGMYLSTINYSMPVDGNSTESITLVGNNKVWFNQSAPNPVGFSADLDPQDDFKLNIDTLAGEDAPYALGSDEPGAPNSGLYLGGIQRRENFRVDLSILPQSIFGVDGNEVGNAYDSVASAPRVHMQNFSVSTDTSREDILELGRKNPYYRSPNFPIEVTCEIEAISVSGDFTSIYENGDPAFDGTINEGNNSSQDTIMVKLNDGTVFDLGNKNRLESVSYGGGDASGGNASMTFSYKNYNDLKVLHPRDPASGIYTTSEWDAVSFNLTP